jgi:hypothetical protein
LIEFKSQKNFRLKDVKKLVKNRAELSYEGYSKKDYWRFVPKDLKTEMEQQGMIVEREPSIKETSSSGCSSSADLPKYDSPGEDSQ